MVVDQNNRFITQREIPRMSLLQTAITGGQLVIFDRQDPADRLIIPLTGDAGQPQVSVEIWEDRCEATYAGDAARAWFSRLLSVDCSLVRMPSTTLRQVDLQYALPGDIAAFSDGYPLLMIGEASLDELNRRLPEPVSMERFRPNLVFSGGAPFDEDSMEAFEVNGLELLGVKLCARCTITTVDPHTGERGREPLATLATFRSREHKVLFGQNVLVRQEGRISRGNSLKVLRNSGTDSEKSRPASPR